VPVHPPRVVLPRPAPAHPRRDALRRPGQPGSGEQRRLIARRPGPGGRAESARAWAARGGGAPRQARRRCGGPNPPRAGWWRPRPAGRPPRPVPAAHTRAPAARLAPARWPSSGGARAGAPERSGHGVPPSWSAAAASRPAHGRRQPRLAPTPTRCRLLSAEISRGCRECRTARTTGLLYIGARGGIPRVDQTPAGPVFSSWVMRNGPLLPQSSGNQSLQLVHGMPLRTRCWPSTHTYRAGEPARVRTVLGSQGSATPSWPATPLGARRVQPRRQSGGTRGQLLRTCGLALQTAPERAGLADWRSRSALGGQHAQD